MVTLYNLFKEGIWIIILIAALVVVFGVAFLLLLLARRRDRHHVKDLKTKLKETHQLLTIDCRNMLTRVEYISQKNPDYEETYNDLNISYDNAIHSFDEPCHQSVESLEVLIKEKVYKNIRDIIESTKSNIQDYQKAVKKLNEELSSLLLKEETCRSNALHVKETFRRIKEDYNDHYTELKDLEESFTIMLNEIDSQFEQFEEKVDSANYDDANEIMLNLDQIVTAMSNVMIDLPYLNTMAKLVVIKHIDETNEVYQNMTDEGYPLHHLHFSSHLEKIQDKLNKINENLLNFNTRGIKEELDSILLELNTLDESFKVEKEAKDKFETELSRTTDNTYDLTKNFNHVKKLIPTLKENYLIDDSYIEQMNLIQEDINQMGFIKRDLDANLHLVTKQPYSVLHRKLISLQQEMKKIENTLSDFNDYMLSLKNDAENIYSSIRINYQKLKQAEYVLRKVNVIALQHRLELKLEQAYDNLKEEDRLLSSTPIDIQTLNVLHKSSQAMINDLVNEIHTNEELARRAEDAIVYANHIRLSYSEANRTLIVAENSFNEADFTRATDEALEIIVKLRPDMAKGSSR